MLFFTLWPDRAGFPSYQAGLAHLRRHPAVCAEVRELAALGLDRSRHVPESSQDAGCRTVMRAYYSAVG
jgi:hypothetical protein